MSHGLHVRHILIFQSETELVLKRCHQDDDIRGVKAEIVLEVGIPAGNSVLQRFGAFGLENIQQAGEDFILDRKSVV